jgi:protein dithiol oxidoreductase (disulfide-forming)
MKRSVVLLVLLTAVGLGGCSRGAQGTAGAPQPSAVAQQPAGNGAGTVAQSSTSAAQAAQGTQAQAQSSQSSSGQSSTEPTAPESTADASDQPGTASLERIAAMPADQQLPQGRWKAGVNYDVISPAQPTSASPGKVEVMEVFWLGCPHCYAFEPYLRAWLKNKPSYIEFVRVPVMWGPVHRLHAQLFYTLEALGRDDLVEKAYDAIHQDNNPLIGETEKDTFEVQLKWAQSQGVNPDAFRKAYNSPGVTRSLQHAQEITDRYHVEGVPEVIIAGKYSSDVGAAGGHDAQLIQLMDDLAASEHRRMQRS